MPLSSGIELDLRTEHDPAIAIRTVYTGHGVGSFLNSMHPWRRGAARLSLTLPPVYRACVQIARKNHIKRVQDRVRMCKFCHAPSCPLPRPSPAATGRHGSRTGTRGSDSATAHCTGGETPICADRDVYIRSSSTSQSSSQPSSAASAAQSSSSGFRSLILIVALQHQQVTAWPILGLRLMSSRTRQSGQ